VEALEIVYKQVGSLKPSPTTPRRHSEKHISEVAKSIESYGFLVPILVDQDNFILAGHCRALAAKKNGIKKVPTVCVDHLTFDQRRAFTIAENQFTITGEFDLEALTSELLYLRDAGIDLDLTGFSEDFFSESSDLPELVPLDEPDPAIKYLKLAYSDDELATVKKNLDLGVSATGCDDYSHLVYQLILSAGEAWKR
jgi:ParB-like chromosome segregation protein Spo0J